jgi:hypothetical protein
MSVASRQLGGSVTHGTAFASAVAMWKFETHKILLGAANVLFRLAPQLRMHERAKTKLGP